MKKYAILALCLVLTTALLVGCGCTNQNMDNANTSAPTVLPTNEEVWDNTNAATSQPTTSATTATDSIVPSGTIDHGNGPLEDSTTNGASGSNETNGINGNNGTNETNTTTATDGTVTGRTRQAIPNG